MSHQPTGSPSGCVWAFSVLAMRKFFIILYVFSAIQYANAQIGFKKVFDIDEVGLAFSSMEYNGDHTVTIYGNLINQGLEYGLLFASFDTLGNLLNYQVMYDSLGDVPTLNFPNSFIKLADGSGYAGIGTYFFREKGFLAIYNNDGSIRKFVEYPNTDVLASFYIEIFEISDGFFILGDKQLQDGFSRIFLIKTDKKGNKLWEKRYGMAPPRENGYGGIVKINDNEYVIGGASTTIPTTPQIVYNTSNFYVIDSLGNIKSSWDSQPSTTDMGVGYGLQRTVQGGWLYSTNELYFGPPNYLYERKLKIIERDINYDIVTERTYGQFGRNNVLQNFKKLSSGNYLILGQRAVKKTPPPPYTYTGLLMGSMFNITSTGDSVWNYLDTAFTFASNLLYDAVELPSGSIIACGYSRTTNILKDWAWLVKVSKDGCVDTLNCISVSSFESSNPSSKMRVYPNPTSDVIYLDLPNDDETTYLIFTIQGRVVMSGRVLKNAVDVSALLPGGYLLLVQSKHGTVTKKIIKT
ncbi:MAG: hypothetical protein RIQ78_117 [Bacteroidota bacterium]